MNEGLLEVLSGQFGDGVFREVGSEGGVEFLGGLESGLGLDRLKVRLRKE